MTRLVLSAAAGVVCAGLFGWRIGAGAAVVVVAAHAVYVRHRPGLVTSWRRGALAERRTGRRLAKLDPSAYYVLHDRALPDTTATNLDHLVVGLTGVYVVISRRWSPLTRLWVERHGMWAGKRPLTGLPATAARMAHTIAELLATELDYDVPVSAVVGVHGARLPYGGLQHPGVAFQRAARLAGYISGGPVVFTNAQVATIAAAAERALPPMAETIPDGVRTFPQ